MSLDTTPTGSDSRTTDCYRVNNNDGTRVNGEFGQINMMNDHIRYTHACTHITRTLHTHYTPITHM